MTGRQAVHLLVAVSASVTLAACSEAKATSTTLDKPSSLTTVAGRPDTRVVTLKAVAAKRIGLQTAAVKDEGATRTVASEAALFAADGRCYVYTALTPLTFVRAEIHVLADDGKITRFSEGPPAGTLVVTTGATEVYGAEFAVGH